MVERGKKSPQHKNSVTKAWLQFQADIEAALFRKPSNAGLYKNLSDMLHSRMDQLEQVIWSFCFAKLIKKNVEANIQYWKTVSVGVSGW